MSKRSAASLRPIGLPRTIVVRTDARGMPVAVTRDAVRGDRGSEARVESVEEVWRVGEAWWREASEARTYFRVVLDGGRPLSIYRDDANGAWFEQPYSEPRHGGVGR